MALGQKIAEFLYPGQLVEFAGDLGGGKTTIIKGIARGLGIKKTVTSPTFNIYKTYKSNKFILDHFDLYRLGDDFVISEQLKEKIKLADSVVVVEWAEKFKSLFSNDYLKIKLYFINENTRKIEILAKGDKSAKVLKRICDDFSG